MGNTMNLDTIAPKKYTLFDLHDINSGIVNYVTEIENELNHPEIFVVAATSCDLQKYGLPVTYKVNGSGAGLSLETAKLSAIGETLERYCLSIIDPDDLLLSTGTDLREQNKLFVPPEKWSLFGSDQQIVPFTRFDENALITWRIADSLVDRVEKYVPASLVYLPYYYHFRDSLGEQMISPSISTGAACAQSKEEAILKGIAELIERDSFMIMWKNRIPCRKITIDSKSKIYDTYKTKFCRPGIDFSLYYTTFDLGMPSFFGIVTDTRGTYISRVVGGAAHPDPEVAALKTVLELVQGLVWKDYKGEVKLPIVPDFENIKSFESRMELYAYNDMSAALEFLPTDESLLLSEIPVAYNYEKGNFKEALKNIIAAFSAKDYDILAVDMSSIEADFCGVHIVKVLIPALEAMDGEHQFQYLGGKRWKEVPVACGYRNPEDQIILNPFPHPYP